MGSAAQMADGMSIGTVARMAGLEVSTIRYYESVGLIPPPRRVSGKRAYDATVFESIALVQLAQDAGFTLAEARALVSGFDRSTPASARWQAMARRKLVDVTERIARAEKMKAILEKLLRCKCQTLGQCVRSRTEALRMSAELPRTRRPGARLDQVGSKSKPWSS